MGFRCNGPCLCCGRQIEYGKPCYKHKAQGDKWLADLFDKWHTPVKYSRCGKQVRINNYSKSTLRPYICKKCWQAIRAVISKERSVNVKGYDPKKIRREQRRQLRVMPYKEYLKTEHWRYVRWFVLEARGRKCQRCDATENLNIHHKSYEHRGRELQHLDTLEVLCRDCHAAEHGIRKCA